MKYLWGRGLNNKWIVQISQHTGPVLHHGRGWTDDLNKSYGRLAPPLRRAGWIFQRAPFCAVPRWWSVKSVIFGFDMIVGVDLRFFIYFFNLWGGVSVGVGEWCMGLVLKCWVFFCICVFVIWILGVFLYKKLTWCQLQDKAFMILQKVL